MRWFDETRCRSCGAGRVPGGSFCPACGGRFGVRRSVWAALGLSLVACTALVVLARGGKDPADPTMTTGAVAKSEAVDARLATAAGRGDQAAVMTLVESSLAKTSRPRDLKRAAALLDPLLRRHPNHRYALRLKANLLRQAFDESGAETAYRDYLRVVPDDMRTRYHLAEVLIRLARYEEAVAELEAITAAFPGYAAAYGALGKVYEAQNLVELAAGMRVKVAALRRKGAAGERPPIQFHPKITDGS